MMLRVISMAAWLAFVAACAEQIGEERAPAPAPAATPAPSQPAEFEPPARPSATANEARIDWQAARTDLASTPGLAAPEGFQIESDGQAPPVPVLLPTGLVTPATATAGPRFIHLPDGYLATYPGAVFDITVSGTNEVFDVTPGLGNGVEDLTFNSTVDGAMVSFSRYGAGYIVEFVCKVEAGGARPPRGGESAAGVIAPTQVLGGTP
ncbi:MAG: hypothetical protein AAF753_03660 [Pseudomonadota bacterium]